MRYATPVPFPAAKVSSSVWRWHWRFQNLVSHKTRIDSLFLDEGFGTLDSETLDTALDALDALNASGKTIGVISHVEAMKERIPVQIKVKKINGLGYSKLESTFAVK
ncbi:exonuclease, dsDNA, ATP-dependent [Escherichia coli]|uniref:Exonuclease, dsDNA, ATP-dependent n=1 Tax=Escherichia coli TaxID=562 RepID=A0A377B225_ECOLX|nr:exonuclease, dsDNA, ATP-dependent [Escherichia coli]